MNLEEFRKALSSDATEENAQLKRQLSDLQTEYHEKLSKLENDLITDFSIVIHFEQHEVPTIDYTTSVVNKVACDRVIYQKGESNVSKI